jgi:hypothetical protein
MKFRGSVFASFTDDDGEHQAALTWGGGLRSHHFPYKLQIDGDIVRDSQVYIENWRMGYIPSLIFILLIFLILILAGHPAGH